MSKKRASISFVAIIISIFLIGIVSAQSPLDDFKNIWQGIIEVLNVIFGTILGSSTLNNAVQGDVLFTKILIFLIILALVWAVLDRIPTFNDYMWVIAIVSIGVALLSTRFLATPGWIDTILLPYSTFGIAITSILPQLIYFYFVQTTMGRRPTLRKISWILAAVVFLGLLISRYGEIGQIKGVGKFNPVWMYGITAIICLGLFIFDGTIRRAWVITQLDTVGSADKNAIIADLRRKIKRTNDDLANGIITAQEHKKMVKEFRSRLLRIEST